MSAVRDGITGVGISREENQRNLEAFRQGKLDVLINVNILTEGVDLPKTKTVFLARPTVSTILMTQMVGRALRGSGAGETNTTYIVSFIDDWGEHIAWVNPESLFSGDNTFSDDPSERIQPEIRLMPYPRLKSLLRFWIRQSIQPHWKKYPFSSTFRLVCMLLRIWSIMENRKAWIFSCQAMGYDRKTKYVRKSMRQLLEKYHLKRRTAQIVEKMERYVRFYEIEMIVNLKRIWDLSSIPLAQLITFRPRDENL